MVERAELNSAYGRVKRVCKDDWRSEAAGQAVVDFALMSLRFLAEECDQVDLKSMVPHKEYFSFERNAVLARPVNSEYFIGDSDAVARNWRKWLRGDLDARRLAQLLYTVALAPCLAFELFNRNDKKSPATYFECMIGHIFAKSLGIRPVRSATLPVAGRSVRMTMDFLFVTAADSPNIHLPVKMSTRERVVQAWAHQRLLDSAHGTGQHKGVMVAFSETKLDTRKREVVEICVPDQWLAYQTLLAKMERIYYFDVPVRYQELTDDFGSLIEIKPFHTFFTEIETVAGR